jgi:hypothetical protein
MSATATHHDGAGRRDAALDALAELRDLHVLRGRRALLSALVAHGTATADDVRAAVDLPDGIDPVCLGAVPLPLARAGIIVRAGYVPTGRPTAHARPVAVWRLADRAAAVAWLREHPDQPDDDDGATVQAMLW